MAFTLIGSHTDDIQRAMDPRTSRTDLVTLAAHRNPEVKAAVAARPDCPLASMLALIHESDVRVRETLATNPAAPASVLRGLAQDKNSRVRELAMRRLRFVAA